MKRCFNFGRLSTGRDFGLFEFLGLAGVLAFLVSVSVVNADLVRLEFVRIPKNAQLSVLSLKVARCPAPTGKSPATLLTLILPAPEASLQSVTIRLRPIPPLTSPCPTSDRS